jgi:hypothetical protein
MPIPFRDENENEMLGSVAYLKIEAYPLGYRGALFLIDSQGVPIEFTYTCIPVPHSFLWRQTDMKRQVERKITTSLLSLCPHTPGLILCLAAEVSSDLFCQDIRVSLPICRIALESNDGICSSLESRQAIDYTPPAQLFWYPSPPSSESQANRLFNKLIAADLLFEPFERASAGLKEVYK